MEVTEHLAGTVGLDHAPGVDPLLGRQGFEQPGDLGRVHAVQDLADPLELALGQRLANDRDASEYERIVRGPK